MHFNLDKTLIVFISFFFITISFSQVVKYEELASIPLADIGDVKVAPNGDTYVLSYSSPPEIYVTKDGGLSWNEFTFPENFEPRDILFFDDSLPIFHQRYVKDTKLMIFENGEWESITPEGIFSDTFLGRVPVKVKGDTIVLNDETSLYISKDRGQNYTATLDASQVIDCREIFLSDEYIYVIKRAFDANSDRVYYLTQFDYDANLIRMSELPEEYVDGNFFSGSHIYANGDDIYFCNPVGDNISFTTDGGKTYGIKLMEEDSNGIWSPFTRGIIDDEMFLEHEGLICSIDLSGDFINEDLVVIDTIGVDVDVQTCYPFLVKNTRHTIENINKKTNDIEFIDNLTFTNTFVSKLEVDSYGHLYAKAGLFLFKYNETSKSWDTVYGNDNGFLNGVMISDDLDLTYSTSINDVYKVFTVDKDGQSIPWNFEQFVDAGSPTSLSIDEGDTRLFYLHNQCINHGYRFESLDGGEFVESSHSAGDCLIGDMHGRILSDGKLYLYGKEFRQNWLFHTIDLQNDYDVESFRLLPFNEIPNDVFNSYLTPDGEMYAHLDVSWSKDTTYYATFYSKDITTEPLRSAGRGPRGFFVKSNNSSASFVVDRQGEHFMRNDPFENYRPLAVNSGNIDLDEVREFTMDTEGRLVLASNKGKIFRSQTDFLVSQEEIIDKNKFSVWPNPAKETLTIQLSTTINGTVSMYNLSGQELKSQILQGNRLHWKIANLNKGVYFISVQDNSKYFEKVKFIKY